MENAKRIKLAICVFGHGGSYQVWASSTDENIVLAIKRKIKQMRQLILLGLIIVPWEIPVLIGITALLSIF